ncbi:MAG: hypothetical protein EXQ86_10960 [Rhodospirillales bacterium]|nr:hypothetical protein [Rhodospirillales bacterium]
MADVRIFRPAKNAMQSGRAKSKRWALEFEPQARKTADPLMGWIGSADTQGQLHLYFETKEEAIAFAEKNGLAYRIEEPKERRMQPKSYAANFAFKRMF